MLDIYHSFDICMGNCQYGMLEIYHSFDMICIASMGMSEECAHAS